ncbi:hypothetical protein KC19_VG082700 [Ceratodon purpureus]|uniref:Uncharacterized protein n=1 Tax=Ceratodon purpureus TaxID=3225 RepID=A0A8T0HN30_CERPU|nr:hypothetical protein KC19_VG082700 [Ceratodon purpureus]
MSLFLCSLGTSNLALLLNPSPSSGAIPQETSIRVSPPFLSECSTLLRKCHSP